MQPNNKLQGSDDDDDHLVLADDHLNGAEHTSNTLMLSNVWSYLPTSRHHAWVCSAGSKGYCTLKEMLQNGIPGNTLLLESGDLRDVGDDTRTQCCLLENLSSPCAVSSASNPQPPTTPPLILANVLHVTVYSNHGSIPSGFLRGCNCMTSLDLTPLLSCPFPRVIGSSFLSGCSGIKTIDLTPLSQLKVLSSFFLSGCTGLESLDLTPLGNVETIHHSFLSGCTSLTSLDLSPMLRLKRVEYALLRSCDAITTVTVPPPSQQHQRPPNCFPPSGWAMVEGNGNVGATWKRLPTWSLSNAAVVEESRAIIVVMYNCVKKIMFDT